MNDNLLQAVEHATYGDIRWGRALDDEIARRGPSAQEYYVSALLREMDMGDFEVTTMSPPNYIRGIKTSHLFALIRATPEQKAHAFTETIESLESAERARQAMTSGNRLYPY